MAAACCLTLSLAAQTDWRQDYRDLMDAADIDDGHAEELMTQLEDLAANKLNINRLTRDDLERLPFLSAQQVEDIMAYVDRYAPVRSLSELRMITSLDADTRRLFTAFVFVGDSKPAPVWPKVSDVLSQGRHTLQATLRVPMYRRRGDRNGYLGYPLRHDVRYAFNWYGRVRFGLTGAQDAGEPFLSNSNRFGYDHYAYYFHLRDMGRLQELNVGTYRVQMGMGLVMNTGFHLGKLATLQSWGRTSHTLTAHSSRSASGHLTGAAATVAISPRWQLTAFASYQPLDATLNDDGTVRTILTDGYHRTPTELARKHNTQVTDLGARLTLTAHSAPAAPSSSAGSDSAAASPSRRHLSLNVLYTHFSRPLQPALSPQPNDYCRYALHGSSFFNASLDYGYANSLLSIAGETAVNGDGAVAALHTVSLRASTALTLMALHRYYDKRYTAFRAYAFHEGTAVQNEHGLYLGAAWAPSPAVLLKGYADYARFPWKRYLVSASSDALDALLYARVILIRCKWEARYRFHLRQRDNEAKTLLRNRYEHRARLRVTVPVLPTGAAGQLTLVTQADGVVADYAAVSRGLMVSQQVRWQHRWWLLDGGAAWFRSDDYDSRLYQYEPSVLYDFSFPAYYGHGLRAFLYCRADIGRRLTLTAKYALTRYFDRDVISSGLQQIDHHSQSDLLLQLRLSL